VKVVYIGGSGRSGSTLLGLLLGELPGYFSAGELRFVWRRGLAENRLCGCGERFRDCSFWSAVGEAAFGGWDAVDPQALLDLEGRLNRHRFIPAMLRPGAAPRFQHDLERYRAILASLYGAVQQVSGCEVLVDGTKEAQYAFLLRDAAGIDLRVIHLVRDSRGVAFSWNKAFSDNGSDALAPLDHVPPARSAVLWEAENALFHLLARLGAPSALLRYETLVASPRRELERVLAEVGLPIATEALDFLEQDRVPLARQHSVSGNPMRFHDGAVALNVDEEWRNGMRRADRSLVSLITFPLLLRYGYMGGRAP
jgi:hypothetical protein